MNWNDVLNLAGANKAPDKRVVKTKEEWKALLTPGQFRVTREHGTERALAFPQCGHVSYLF